MAHRPPEQITPGMKGPMSLKSSKELFLEQLAKSHPGIPKLQMFKLHTSDTLMGNAPPRPRRLTGKIPRKK